METNISKLAEKVWNKQLKITCDQVDNVWWEITTNKRKILDTFYG